MGRLCWQADRSAAGVGLGSGCGTRSGDRGSVALYRHRMRIGRLDHGHDDGGHDDQGGPLSRAATGKHSQGRSSPKSAQAPQERQLLLNLRIGHRWRHGRGTPRRRRGCCTLSDREGKACGGRPPRGDTSPANGSPAEKKPALTPVISERALPERSGEGARPAGSETVMKHHGGQRHVGKQTVPIRTNRSPSMARVRRPAPREP